jgi:hypothetical protein
LSQKRADNVMQYMISQGGNRNLVAAQGFRHDNLLFSLQIRGKTLAPITAFATHVTILNVTSDLFR